MNDTIKPKRGQRRRKHKPVPNYDREKLEVPTEFRHDDVTQTAASGGRKHRFPLSVAVAGVHTLASVGRRLLRVATAPFRLVQKRFA